MKEGKKKPVWKRNLVIAAAALLAAGIAGRSLVTCNGADVLFFHSGEAYQNCTYEPLGGGMLCVSRSSLSFVDARGREVWKLSAEFVSPVVVTAGDKAICYDKGGNGIVVVDQDGKKTETRTPYPIERGAISESGSFAAILENGRAPQVVCYDDRGNEKAKHQTSLKNRGYPVALALSPKGDRLVVSYLDVRCGTASGLATCFELKKGGREEDLELPGNLSPEVGFYGDDKVVLAGSAAVVFADAGKTFKSVKTIKNEGEIEKVAMGEEGVAIVGRSYGAASRLKVYSPEGEKLLSAGFDDNFEHVALLKKEVFCYSGTHLKILTLRGREKFLGTVPKRIEKIQKAGFGKKYLIAGDDGVCGIRIRKVR